MRRTVTAHVNTNVKSAGKSAVLEPVASPSKDKLKGTTPVVVEASVEPLQIKGVCSLTVSEPQTGKSIVADFVVTQGKATTLLARKASEFLGMLRVGVSINTCDVKLDRKAALREKFPNVFKGLGKLKDYQLKLHIDETVTPVQPLRRIPFSRWGKVAEKLNLTS